MSATLRLLSLAALAVAFLLLVFPAPERGYYPLRPGVSWEYEVSNSAVPTTGVQLKVSNIGHRQIGSWHTAAQRLEAGPSVGYRFNISRPDWIAVVGEQRPGDAEPKVIDPPATVLKLPIAVGDSWPSNATTTTIASGTKVETTATVESISERVEVPAGVFEHCVRVHSVGSAELPASDQNPGGPVRVDTTLWYAPGAGLVQIERKESGEESQPATEVTYRLARLAS